MAASLRANSGPDSKLVQRQRHGGQDRQALESRHRDSRSRRGPKTERHREQSGRRSPPRQIQRVSQLPTPVSTPNTSTPSLHASLEPRSFAMERTPSGNSIISDKTFEPWHNNTLKTCSDDEAARRVKLHFRRLTPDGMYERILRNLIHGHDHNHQIDDTGLDGILTAADSIFFDNQLSQRVHWEWSHQEQPRYQSELIGTTALRPAKDQEGYETLIVLSEPILRNPDYDRRLLISVFLHELIHCYLFIMCGFPARDAGGHTKGFHEIAAVIDHWAEGCLRLCSMKANLDYFRKDRVGMMDLWMEARHEHDGCNQSPRPERDYFDGSVVRAHEFREGYSEGFR